MSLGISLGLGIGSGRRRSTFSSSAVPGLIWDLDGGDYNATTGAWPNSAGTGPAFGQAVSGARPAKVSLSGMAWLSFDGVDDFLRAVSDWTPPAAAECFLVCMLAIDAPTVNGNGLWRFGTEAGGFFEVVPYIDDHSYDGWGSTARKDAGTGFTVPMRLMPCIYSVRSGPGHWSVHLNGSQKFTTSTNTVGFQTRPTLGGSGNDPAAPTLFHKGGMGRFVCYDHILTANERAYVLPGMAARDGIILA